MERESNHLSDTHTKHHETRVLQNRVPPDRIPPMAPLPKRRISRARAGRRQQHIKVARKILATCGNCGAKKLQHTICPECKTYTTTTTTKTKSSPIKAKK